jgi:hypothetical protein
MIDLTHGMKPSNTAVITTREQGDVLIELNRTYLIKTVYGDHERRPHGSAALIERVKEPRFPNGYHNGRTIWILNTRMRNYTEEAFIDEDSILRLERA